ncbi:MAG: hypothetical protein AAFY07_11465 [Pseudomonadota bacterium]
MIAERRLSNPSESEYSTFGLAGAAFVTASFFSSTAMLFTPSRRAFRLLSLDAWVPIDSKEPSCQNRAPFEKKWTFSDHKVRRKGTIGDKQKRVPDLAGHALFMTGRVLVGRAQGSLQRRRLRGPAGFA